ncbi:PQQ-binding-like beta-propeller repeat protein [Parabacteroides sp. PF5-9]|uniref:outer membrane protein assembly factor BamB family protein n=1 Tax=Parabacteroides sp. PF5-9 TaxID=1742404 RepID=UPI00247627BE|nr:PQQ-binding-like beta-propeller repeat protein [Parabacteroides sp. PF5-9]
MVLLFACLLIGNVVAQTPYGWRGPTRDGIYPENGLLKSWSASGPEQLWETLDVGKGYSSPVIVGDRLYITGMNEAENGEIFSAYTLDGKKIYSVEYGKPWTDSYPETRTTPAIDGDKAYVISGSGEIVCLNIADGSIVWKVDGGTTFGRKTGNWGTSECPLVFDNKVIYTPSGDQTTMVALNTQNGQVVWKTDPLGDTGAYVSPLLIRHNGKQQIVGSTASNVFGVNPESGKIEWQFSEWGGNGPWANIAPNTPLYKDGKIFFSHGYDIGGYMIQLNNDLTSASLLWKTDALDTHHGGYVLMDGVIYGSNWLNNNSGNWVGIDWDSGATKFENPWDANGKGSIVAADGMMIAYDERRGMVGLIKPSVEKFDVISQFRITKGEGPHWAHPVVVNGTLFIRHGNALMAYKVK